MNIKIATAAVTATAAIRAASYGGDRWEIAVDFLTATGAWVERQEDAPTGSVFTGLDVGSAFGEFGGISARRWFEGVDGTAREVRVDGVVVAYRRPCGYWSTPEEDAAEEKSLAADRAEKAARDDYWRRRAAYVRRDYNGTRLNGALRRAGIPVEYWGV